MTASPLGDSPRPQQVHASHMCIWVNGLSACIRCNLSGDKLQEPCSGTPCEHCGYPLAVRGETCPKCGWTLIDSTLYDRKPREHGLQWATLSVGPRATEGSGPPNE